MNCEGIERYLSAYVDGELAGVEMLRVRRHLRECPGCRREYESLLDMKRLLCALPVKEPDPEMIERACAAFRVRPARTGWEAIRRGITEPIGMVVSGARAVLKRRQLWWARWGLATAAVGALMLVMFLNPAVPPQDGTMTTGAFDSVHYVETAPVIFPSASGGPMGSPELHLAVDESVSVHYAGYAVPAPDSGDPR